MKATKKLKENICTHIKKQEEIDANYYNLIDTKIEISKFYYEIKEIFELNNNNEEIKNIQDYDTKIRLNENKKELENIYNDLNQKYWDIVNKYYSPKKQEILKILEIIKKKGSNGFEEDIKKILENDENKKNNNMKKKINDVEKVKELKNKFEILIRIE